MLSEEAITEIQKLYLHEFGRSITFEQARELATYLLRFYKTITENCEPKGNHADEENR